MTKYAIILLLMLSGCASDKDHWSGVAKGVNQTTRR